MATKFRHPNNMGGPVLYTVTVLTNVTVYASLQSPVHHMARNPLREPFYEDGKGVANAFHCAEKPAL